MTIRQRRVGAVWRYFTGISVHFEAVLEGTETTHASAFHLHELFILFFAIKSDLGEILLIYSMSGKETKIEIILPPFYFVDDLDFETDEIVPGVGTRFDRKNNTSSLSEGYREDNSQG